MIRYPFIVKTQNKLDIDARYLNTTNIILHGEKKEKKKPYLSKSEVTSMGGCDSAQAQLRGAIPLPRTGAAAGRSYPMPKVRGQGQEELPHVQGKEQRLHFAGAAMKRYHTSMVRENQIRR